MPEPNPATVRRWRRLLADEREECRIYRGLASRRVGEERAILLELADAEERHAAHWEALLGDRADPGRRGALRLRVLAFLARHLGWVVVLAMLQRAETRAAQTAGTPEIAADERIHGEVVRALATRGRARMSGTLRAAVFGANDGLVSNVSLVLGVIGGGADDDTILLTGLAGLLAGALSMAAGEFISVSSQRELLEASTPDDEARRSVPQLDVDANELALLYRARGMAPEEAERRAAEMLGSATAAPPARSEADGLDVVGSGIRAAGSSFLFFSAGAAIPVLPFLFGMDGGSAVVIACVVTGFALMLTGAVVALLSGGPPMRRALRQLTIGTAAAAVTFFLGTLFDATVV